MALVGELSKRLDNDEEPLQKRLCLAQNIFLSSQLSIPNKEEIIVSWLCRLVRNSAQKKKKKKKPNLNTSCIDPKDVWSTFQACVASHRPHRFSVLDLRPSTKHAIVEVLCEHLAMSWENEMELLSILECAACILESVSFQRFLRQNIPVYCNLIKVLLNTLYSSSIQDHIKIRLAVSIRTFHRDSLLQSSVDSAFLKEVLFPLTNFVAAEESNNLPLTVEVKKCFEQLLFPKSSSELIQFLHALFHVEKKVPDLVGTKALETDKYPVAVSLMDSLQESAHVFDDKTFVRLCSLVFETCVTSTKSNSPESSFFMFVTMCHLLGIRVGNMKSKLNCKRLRECIKPAMAEPTEVSILILRNLIEILNEQGVSLNVEVRSTRFLDWLQMLLGSLFPTTAGTLKAEGTLKLLTSFIKLSPFTLEANAENVLSFISSKPFTVDEIPSYSAFLLALFKMYHKMNRIHKIIFLFLSCLKNGIMKDSESSCSMWMPSEISEEISQFSTTMPSESAIQTFETLLLHLQNGLECLHDLEQKGGHQAELMLQIVCELSCAVLQGVRMVEHCVAPHPRVGYCKVMKSFRECLGILGHFVLRVDCNSPLLKSFLKLSYYWGAEALLIRQYAMVGRSTLLEAIGCTDTSDCNKISLNYIHSYFSDDEWQNLRLKVEELEDNDSAEIFLKLDLQLLCAFQLFENSSPAEAKDLARRCMSLMTRKLNVECGSALSHKEWVFDMMLLSKTLETPEVVEFSNCLVTSLLKVQESSYFLETLPLLSERRTLACCLIFATMSSLEHSLKAVKRQKSDCNPKKWTTAKRAFAMLKNSSAFLIETEINQSPEYSSKLKNELVEMTKLVQEQLNTPLESSDANHSDSDAVNLARIKAHLHLLRLLPLEGLLVPSRFAIFVTLLSLAVDCQHLPMSPDRNGILSELFDRVLVGLAERKLFLWKYEGFGDGHLEKYLAQCVITCGVSRRLLEMIMFEALEGESGPDYIGRNVAFLSKKFENIKLGKENILLASIILQNLVCRKRIFEVSADSSGAEDQILKLRYAGEKLALSLCALVEGRSVKPKFFLHVYALSLDFLLKGKAIDKVIQSLVPDIEDYCSIAVSKLHSPDALQRKAAEALLTAVFSHEKQLQEYIPHSLLRDVWFVLSSGDSFSDGPVNLLCHFITKDIMDELLLKTVELYRSSDVCLESDFAPSNLIDLWSALLSCQSTVKVNADLWQLLVRRLFEVLYTLNKVPQEQLLKLVLKVVSTSEIVMDMEMVDQCLLTLNGINFPTDVVKFAAVGNKYLAVLSALLFHRKVFALDCVPSLLQKLYILLKKLGSQSRFREDLAQSDRELLADLAYGIEKFVSSFTRPDFKVALKRVSAYLIADIISIFEEVSLCSAVKVHFQNMAYVLMSMIDGHSIKFLLQVMSPASTEIFKSLYSNYTKFHAFKGKI